MVLFILTGATGSVTVNGRLVNVPIVFVPVTTYTVEFVETGLAPGTAWSVSIGGFTVFAPGTNFTAILLPDGNWSVLSRLRGRLLAAHALGGSHGPGTQSDDHGYLPSFGGHGHWAAEGVLGGRTDPHRFVGHCRGDHWRGAVRSNAASIGAGVADRLEHHLPRA